MWRAVLRMDLPEPAKEKAVMRHRVRRGIADALRTGYLHARGRVLVFYPADLQYKPEDIPRLVSPILSGDVDMVTGFKQGRYERRFVSRVYNGLSRKLFQLPVRVIPPARVGIIKIEPPHVRVRIR